MVYDQTVSNYAKRTRLRETGVYIYIFDFEGIKFSNRVKLHGKYNYPASAQIRVSVPDSESTRSVISAARPRKTIAGSSIASMKKARTFYVSDFTEQGVYACRILVPGMSEIDPVEDLEWENNSIGNALRPKLVRLSDLSEEECASLLADLQTMNLNDEHPLWEILGLAIPAGTPWKQLRIGELKTLLALAIGDEDAVLEGCDWIHHFNDLPASRRLVYRCIESLLKIDDVENYRRSLVLLYGAEAVRQAEALCDRSEHFFGLETLSTDMQGSTLHQTLLAAYDKLFA